MRNKELLDYFQTAEDKVLNFDEEAIVATYQKNNNNRSLSMKILSLFGGLGASLAFLRFLYVGIGIHHSEVGLLVFGIICIAGSIWISKAYDKIIIDTVSVSLFFTGFILLGFNLYTLLKGNGSMISIIFIIIAFCSLTIARNYMLSFISVLIINGRILMLILSNEGYNLIPIYISALALIITYFFLKEAKIITTNKGLSQLYNPIRTGLVFSFLSGLALLGIKITSFQCRPTTFGCLP
jgi:hypothetical protein